MSEKKKIDERELENVNGGADAAADSFDAVWEAFAVTHCHKCAVPYKDTCAAEIRRVRAQWEAGKPLKCMAFIDKC